ncbi:MAG: WD40/YVTN/BNR-like repeat-containing protein, partial [Actinomycetota bacterium]
PSGLPASVGALATADDDTVYASTSDGLHRSTDRARSWKRMGSELVFAVAAGGDSVFASKAQGVGIRVSEDGGKSWTDAGEGLGPAPIVALATSEDGKTVVAADQAAGIWRSVDGGKAWTRVPTP